MVIDVRGVQVANYIKEVGKYTLKIVSIKEAKNDKYENVVEVSMINKEKLTFTEKFLIRDTVMWKIAGLIFAAKLPQYVDTSVLEGRYVTAHLVEDSYETNGQTKTYLKAESYAPNDAQKEDNRDDKIVEVAEQKQEIAQTVVNENIELDEGEILF